MSINQTFGGALENRLEGPDLILYLFFMDIGIGSEQMFGGGCHKG